MKDIYFAGGCFWGIEEYFSRIEGVTDTEVGYANSKVENPSYELVCSGMTDSAETVKIIYDENIISLENLLEKLFLVIDPTLLNRQGNDIGSQYRTGIYYNEDEDLEIINSYIDSIKNNYKKDILTEVLRIKNFYPAEEYHQDYLKKNPNGYCHIKLD
ncbi:peptide-methionine (S)-S-oxide reductase MsrA [Peptoniphilus obesi]|uniref:peptide-methionine (S)-S-oxide reductase MsrA n=1 Tax=Peptoniphilus obesi TaxID=1472765 RepID=UPI0004AFDA85|nr:peptide-methionine (S)-S-oxide reductase MsrA [Peptoniphilus obesi]